VSERNILGSCHVSLLPKDRSIEILAYNSYRTGVSKVQEKLNFFLNNQQNALIIPNLFCYKTLHVSGILSAHHQEFSIVHSALVSFMQVSDDRFQAESS